MTILFVLYVLAIPASVITLVKLNPSDVRHYGSN